MQTFETTNKPVKAWVDGVEFDENARRQVSNMASLPFVHSHVAVMPDVHVGIGATVGSVIPTIGAIVPAAVGVDIGCGMIAQRTTQPDNPPFDRTIDQDSEHPPEQEREIWWDADHVYAKPRVGAEQ